MDELLRDFLTETSDNLDLVDAELVRFEQEPNNAEILAKVFRLVHTIKGTCGFLALSRLETLTHAAETLMGKFRDGMPVTADAVTLILSTLDRVKSILDNLEAEEKEPDGSDSDLIEQLARMASGASAVAAMTAAPEPEPETPSVEAEPELATDRCVDENRRSGEDRRNEDRRADTGDRPAAENGDKLASHSIRVSVDTLDYLMTTVSELVLTRNQLLQIARRHEDSDFKVPLQRLSNVTAELQEGVMKTRMQPIGNAWQKLPRIVRDLAAELGKDIELEMHGAETELDRQVLELVKDPLTHLVRNCADHGLESPAERIALSKAKAGTIRLSACHQGGHILIEIADDGRGLNLARIKAKAIASGFASEPEIAAKSEGEICNLIFAPGFSTAAEVTSISGRGVGMDVVKSNIEQIGGTVDLKSLPGAGTTFIIKIPLTLAIVSALIVEAEGERLAIPQLSVLELVRAGGGEHRIERIKDTPVLRLRNTLLPLLHLKDVLKLGTADSENGFVVVTQVGNLTFGMIVDAVAHTEEIVIKPMSSKLRHIGVFSGTTILGDGSVIMILDPNGVAQALGRTAQMAHAAEAAERRESEETAQEKTVSLLVFRAGSQRPKAVPLSLVTRLEEIDCRRIEVSDGRHLVQYRDQLMPLLRIDTETGLKQEGSQPILVFSDQGRSMGLVVDEIVDIVEDRLDIEVASNRPGVLGFAVIKGATTEIVDVGHFLPQAFEDWFRNRDSATARAARNVLLVDDSAFFRDMLAPLIKAAGYRVTAVGSAADALATLQSNTRFDLVVTDTDMPGMDGFALAQAMRAEPGIADIPVIALAAMVSSEAIARGRAVGFHDFVAKFDRTGLIAAIKEQSASIEQAA
ncbi:MAG TPA: hybrid sensor histidine kinase/response regulator [Xanthobacteraceae bacterium]|jgi:two-component system chemotaxis sensor kinase CheA|nr:hybrid sensor histidine kinase/response regulator [Xanthobacteraceae bacterium]